MIKLHPLSLFGALLAVLGLAASLGPLRWLSPWAALAGAVMAEEALAKAGGHAHRWTALATGLAVALTCLLTERIDLGIGILLAVAAHRGRPALPELQKGGWLAPGLGLLGLALAVHAAWGRPWLAWFYAAFAFYHAYTVWLRTLLARDVRVESQIQAEPEKVWEVLTDFAAFPQWNPFVVHVLGEPSLGHRLDVTLKLATGKPMRFRPRVTACAPGHELEWLGQLALPTLFDGRHRFVVERHEGGTRFTHSEHFSGALVPLIFDRHAITEAFAAMNQALKARVEGGGAPAAEA